MRPMTATSQLGRIDDGDQAAITALRQAFAAQRRAHQAYPYPDLRERTGHLQALAAMLVRNRKRIQEAMSEDFRVHSRTWTDIGELVAVIVRAQAAAGSLAEWMADEPREVDPFIYGDARAFVRPQPKGVIGSMAPWNTPFEIGVGVLIDMLAAGNRVILKPSDHTPACGIVIADMLAETFDADHVTAAVGGLELARFFPTLPWDHLMYTGSTAVGRQVMKATAENLVPVTLELGGKCPAILTATGVTERNVEQIIDVKRVRNGQNCISVDHVFVPRAQLARFVDLARGIMARRAPAFSAGDDTTGLVTQAHYDRIVRLLADARDAGSEVVDIDVDGVVDPGERRVPISLVIDPDPELGIMQEEIFGPILPVRPYDHLDGVLDQINDGDRPLAVYVFGDDANENEELLNRVTSGGAAINAALWQGGLPSLGFGGVGASGMGRYHGIDGFREFSNLRGVFVRGGQDMTSELCPPHSAETKSMVEALLLAAADAGTGTERPA
ncbi:aldehyde dehydrogenase family protein [Nonomuraea lactucae]|uniref:aldehyde dehydrogenase family protein n=1 Tax=Nonomuraea lactucae TaxID=2249762 RepID=UPI000DE233A3|nr:aldehyde dehydrogenase family protein [Nonomuraea lactucae]